MENKIKKAFNCEKNVTNSNSNGKINFTIENGFFLKIGRMQKKIGMKFKYLLIPGPKN